MKGRSLASAKANLIKFWRSPHNEPNLAGESCWKFADAAWPMKSTSPARHLLSSANVFNATFGFCRSDPRYYPTQTQVRSIKHSLRKTAAKISITWTGKNQIKIYGFIPGSIGSMKGQRRFGCSLQDKISRVSWKVTAGSHRYTPLIVFILQNRFRRFDLEMRSSSKGRPTRKMQKHDVIYRSIQHWAFSHLLSLTYFDSNR